MMFICIYYVYYEIVRVILKYKCTKLKICLEPRQLKKKLSQSDANKLKKQLQKANSIIENDADLLYNDLSTNSTGKTCKFVTMYRGGY